MLIVVALTVGCTRHQKTDDRADRITVCGMVRLQDGAPVPKALFHLYNLPKDTRDDVVKNRYELAETDAAGRFVLRSTYESRPYWLAISRSSACAELTSSELEPKRIPVTFHQSGGH